MKLLQNLKIRGRALDSRGVSHIIVPLLVVVGVAVVGAYALVASHAQKTDLSSATAATSKTARSTAGYVNIYSEQGHYSAVKISVVGADPATHKCSGLNTSGVRSLSKTRPVKIRCNAIAGPAAYMIYYGSKHKDGTYHFLQEGQALNVDAGFCLTVNHDASLNAQAKGANCSNPDKISKTDTVVRVLPTVNADKKHVNGYVEVASADPGHYPVFRTMCAGQVSVTFEQIRPTAGFYQNAFNFPLKYTESATTKDGYCVARIRSVNTSDFLKPGGYYKVKAEFAGNAYMNASSNHGFVLLP